MFAWEMYPMLWDTWQNVTCFSIYLFVLKYLIIWWTGFGHKLFSANNILSHQQLKKIITFLRGTLEEAYRNLPADFANHTHACFLTVHFLMSKASQIPYSLSNLASLHLSPQASFCHFWHEYGFLPPHTIIWIPLAWYQPFIFTCCHVNKAQEALSTPSTPWCLCSPISLNTSLLALAGNEDVPPTSARGPAARWLIEGQCDPLAGSTPMLLHSLGRAGSAGSLYLSRPQWQRPGLPGIRPLSLGPKLFILNNGTQLTAGTCSGHEQETAFPRGFQAGSALITSHENCTLELHAYIHIQKDDLLYYWWEPHRSGHIFDI